jgi:hypothetical protein
MLEKTKEGDKIVINEKKELDGIIEVTFAHEVSKTTHRAVYSGPFIDPKLWHQVMSFFRWTYETYKSESQVRLFIDPVASAWVAWAAPQESGTGMTAHEIDSEDAKKQRAELPNAAKLVLFGTVHHHCSAGAFQSGTDETNEKSQDGLHITVGKIDSGEHDIHSRLYISGVKFDPDLSLVWDIGEEIRSLIPQELHHKVAVHQMTRKVEEEFPAMWRENMIERKKVSAYVGGLGYDRTEHYSQGSGGNGYFRGTLWSRVEAVAKRVVEMEADAYNKPISVKSLRQTIEFLYNSNLCDNIMRESTSANVEPLDVTIELNNHVDLYCKMYSEIRSGKKDVKLDKPAGTKTDELGKVWKPRFASNYNGTPRYVATRGVTDDVAYYTSWQEANQRANELNLKDELEQEKKESETMVPQHGELRNTNGYQEIYDADLNKWVPQPGYCD